VPRPTIGVIAGWQVYERTTPNWFLEALLRGVSEAGRRLGCDILLSCGVDDRIDDPRAVRPGWPAARADTRFVPVGPWNTEGLVFVSPLRTPERRGYARRLREDGFPVVYVGGGDGRPAVIADGAAGFREALEHLRGHGHRKVAFVSGDPLDCGDSLDRLDTFRRLRAELDLEPDEELIAPGLHSELGGYEAMRAILGAGRPFTAVLASNDVSAIGAIRALAETGRRVPEDAAVVGFDDQPLAFANRPPLATVRYPLADAGALALERLVAMVKGEDSGPDEIRVPTRFVGRRSCGCLPAAGDDEAVAALVTGPPWSPLLVEIDHTLAEAGSPLPDAVRRRLSQRLVDGWAGSLTSRTSEPFERALLELLDGIEKGGDAGHRWQAALSRLRARDLPALDPPARMAAERLLHLGRIALSESAERAAARQRLLGSARADRLSALTVPLQSVQDEPEIPALVVRYAPEVGLRPVCLAQYEEGVAAEPAVARVRWLDAAASGEEERCEVRRVLGADRPRTEAPRCLAVVPLTRPHRTLGFFAFESESLEPGAAVALQLAVALESVRLQAAVRELTLTDELTGLHNRRHFDVELRREAERARRFGRRLALALVDVDRFMRYNDRFGHPAGDEALRRVGRCLASALPRRLDALARYGGEEFAVLLAETDASGAMRVAERLRRAVEEAAVFRRPLTISVGVAALEGAAVDADGLVTAADEALYRAKSEGRNRVRLAPGPTAASGREEEA
jgi:diguanylate cyclase (GGDEF)-like protein